MHAIVRNGVPELLPSGRPFVDNNGTRWASNVVSLWSEQELNAIGIYKVVDTPIPDGKVETGWTLSFDGSTVTRVWILEDAPAPGPVPVPRVVSRFQAQAALLAANKLGQVKAAMNQANAFDKLAWEEAAEFRRNSPTLIRMAQALNMTDQELDDLFRAAAEIEA